MKSISILSILALVFIMSSCKKASNNSSDGVSFKDRDLQGVIDDQDWNYVSAVAEPGADSSQISITIYDIAASGDPCDVFSYTSAVNVVMFSVDFELGQSNLKLDLSGDTSQTVTLYDGTINNIASEGAVDLEEITDSAVSGRLNAYFDSKNNVNGNFTAVLCSKKF